MIGASVTASPISYVPKGWLDCLPPPPTKNGQELQSFSQLLNHTLMEVSLYLSPSGREFPPRLHCKSLILNLKIVEVGAVPPS